MAFSFYMYITQISENSTAMGACLIFTIISGVFLLAHICAGCLEEPKKSSIDDFSQDSEESFV